MIEIINEIELLREIFITRFRFDPLIGEHNNVKDNMHYSGMFFFILLTETSHDISSVEKRTVYTRGYIIDRIKCYFCSSYFGSYLYHTILAQYSYSVAIRELSLKKEIAKLFKDFINL